PVATTRGTARLTSTAPTTGDADDGTAVSSGAKTTTSEMYIKLSSTVFMKPGSIIRFDNTGRQFWVISVTRGVADPTLLGYVKVRPIRDFTVTTLSTEFPDGETVRVIGTAYGEGQSGRGLQRTPVRRPYPV